MLPEDQRRFVEDVLSLYSALHFSYGALKKQRLIKWRWISPNAAKFFGFDGSREDEKEHYAYCQEIIKQQGRFNELNNDDLEVNSGYPSFATLDRYRRRLAAWEEMGRPEKLSRKQIYTINEAERPPAQRRTLRNKVRSFFDRDWRQLLAWIVGLFVFGSIFLPSTKALLILDVPVDRYGYFLDPKSPYSPYQL